MRNFFKEDSKYKIVAKSSIISVTTLLMMFAGIASIDSHYHSVYAAAKNATSSSSSSTSKGGGTSTKNSTSPIGSSTFLNVITKVVNSKGGTAKPSDFTITVSGKSPSPKSFSGSSSGTSVTLKAGKYKVTGSGPTGYTPSYSSGCSGTASGGTPLKCTVSNKYTAATPGSTTFLNVITNVDNSNGGTKKPSDFTISVSGNSPSPKFFSGSSSGTSVALNAGKYRVAGIGPSGYTIAYASGCSGTASGGTPLKCTISASYSPTPTPSGSNSTSKKNPNGDAILEISIVVHANCDVSWDVPCPGYGILVGKIDTPESMSGYSPRIEFYTGPWGGLTTKEIQIPIDGRFSIHAGCYSSCSNPFRLKLPPPLDAVGHYNYVDTFVQGDGCGCCSHPPLPNPAYNVNCTSYMGPNGATYVVNLYFSRDCPLCIR
jgi:hypothetical protein